MSACKHGIDHRRWCRACGSNSAPTPAQNIPIQADEVEEYFPDLPMPGVCSYCSNAIRPHESTIRRGPGGGWCHYSCYANRVKEYVRTR